MRVEGEKVEKVVFEITPKEAWTALKKHLKEEISLPSSVDLYVKDGKIWRYDHYAPGHNGGEDVIVENAPSFDQINLVNIIKYLDSIV